MASAEESWHRREWDGQASFAVELRRYGAGMYLLRQSRSAQLSSKERVNFGDRRSVPRQRKTIPIHGAAMHKLVAGHLP
jgi:hypothetical protein